MSTRTPPPMSNSAALTFCAIILALLLLLPLAFVAGTGVGASLARRPAASPPEPHAAAISTADKQRLKEEIDRRVEANEQQREEELGRKVKEAGGIPHPPGWHHYYP